MHRSIDVSNTSVDHAVIVNPLKVSLSGEPDSAARSQHLRGIQG